MLVPMSTKNPEPAAPQGAAAPVGASQAVAESVKVGDRIKVRVVVGGPAIATVEAVVLKVHKAAPAGKAGGPYLDLEFTGREGLTWTAETVGPEPPEGANLNNLQGQSFPCWARTPAPK
jgi:hypothetical protein